MDNKKSYSYKLPAILFVLALAFACSPAKDTSKIDPQRLFLGLGAVTVGGLVGGGTGAVVGAAVVVAEAAVAGAKELAGGAKEVAGGVKEVALGVKAVALGAGVLAVIGAVKLFLSIRHIA